MNFRLGLSLMTVLLVAGCRGGEGEDTGEESGTGTGTDTGDAPATELELDEFLGQAEAAFCEWAVACRAFGVEARCAAVNHLEDRINMRWLTGVGADESIPVAYYKQAVEVGRIEYDGKQAATCLAYVSARSCDVPEYHVTTEEEDAGRIACAQVFQGRMGKNGPCMSALECAEEAICGFDPNCVDMCCAGACRVLPSPIKLGEPCNGNQTCEGDGFCAFDPNTGTPTVCTAPPVAGQPCPNFRCGGGAQCEWNGSIDVCVALRPAGTPCEYEGQCEPGIVCVRDQNYDNGVCRRPADEGEPCDWLSPDEVCRRLDNLCDPVSKVCAPLPGNGEPCPQYRCRGDFFCAANMRCSPVADVGEGCGYDPNSGAFIPCSGDAVCGGEDFDNQTCIAPSGDAPCPVPVDPLAGG